MKPLTQLLNPSHRISGKDLRNQNIITIFKTSIYGKPLILKVYTRFHNASIKRMSGVENCHRWANVKTKELLNELEKR